MFMGAESIALNPNESIGLNHLLARFPPMNLTTFGERLQQALDLRGRDAPSLIKALGVSKGAIYNILDNTTRPEKVWGITALRICRELGVGLDWFLTGQGPMIPPLSAAANDDDWGDIEGYAQAVGLSDGVEAQEYAETHKLKFRADSLRKKRLNPRNLAVFYGQGDSMEPRIHSGDAILFDQSDTRPRDGQLYVILVPGAGAESYTVKRCELLDDLVLFKADNPKGDHGWKKPRRMDDPRRPIKIIGRVRWIGSWEG
jgi:phage repressor protein C with HTH and peptisase S24 domain